ncbi:MAG: RNA pseudouridine synthase [Bdellovibrionales bacterium]|nr:RNA pseudouridine synthase [Bdellovibrionales bacterium]
MSRAKVKRSHLSSNLLTAPLKARQVVTLPLNLLNHLQIAPSYSGPPIEVLFENNDLMAISKPYNLHSHPLNYLEYDNCLSWLRCSDPKNSKQVLQICSSSMERGLLNRLDFVTSGVLILIKHEKLHQALRNNFSLMVKEKIYLAIVEGELVNQGDQCHYFLSSGPKGRKVKVSSVNTAGAKEGWLALSLLKYDSLTNRSLVKVRLLSGLRHQIRAQLAFLGHPIVGDTLYGGIADPNSSRVFLHSYCYRLQLPDGEIELKDATASLFGALFNMDGIF